MLSKARKTAKPALQSRIHDRKSSDLTINAIVAPAIVDDPMALNPGDKIAVMRSLRDDPLAWMASRSMIEEYQLAAGKEWQKLLEHAQIGGVRAIDPTKEAVDGKQIPEPITDRQIKAVKKLKEADKALGVEGAQLIRDILERRLKFEAVAVLRIGDSSERTANYIGRRFRECLDTLAVLFGFATRHLLTGRIDSRL